MLADPRPFLFLSASIRVIRVIRVPPSLPAPRALVLPTMSTRPAVTNPTELYLPWPARRVGFPAVVARAPSPFVFVRVHCWGAIMGTHATSSTTTNSLTRRRLLQVGSLGLLGLSLPELLQGQAQGASPGRDRSCIFIVQYGGASHVDSLDPKPDAPDDVRGPYKPIATATAGLRLGELLPRLGRLSR